MKRPGALTVISSAIGAPLVAAHVYLFLHLPSGVALGSAAGIIAIVFTIKAALVRFGLHRVLRRLH